MESERICINCNSFLPYPLIGLVEFGVCSNDPLFEPYIDEIFETESYHCCLELAEQKKFDGYLNLCGDFEMAKDIAEIAMEVPADDFVEIDFNDEKKLTELITLVSKNESVSGYLKEFQSPIPEVRLSAFRSVSILVGFGNENAQKLLLKSFVEIPPPITIQDTHFKLEAFRYVDRRKSTDEIFPILAHDLYATKSNNQTRQWISEILDFLNIHRNRKDVSEFLRKILTEKQFTYRLKDKVKSILNDEY